MQGKVKKSLVFDWQKDIVIPNIFLLSYRESMKSLWTKKRIILGVIFLVSLLFILFVGRSFNTETLQRDWILTTNGINNFRKGLDISGGTKLVYKVDLSTYQKLYQNPDLRNWNNEDYETVKRQILDIIIKNIDARISALGVSDYKAYPQENSDTQIVVEIWGVADLDQAKEMIGKTVELEFRLGNDQPHNAESIAKRKALAETLYAQAQANPDQMLANNMNKGGEDIHANILMGTLEQLPSIYTTQSELLNTLNTGAISPLLEGAYHSTSLSGSADLAINGFLFFRLLEKDPENQTYLIEEVFVNERENRVLAQGNDGSILNGAYFTLAEPSSTEFGQPSVSISFNTRGGEIFCEITKGNIGRSMAIFIWGQQATAATIQDAICDGRAQISGGFDREHAISTAKELNSGNMPAPLTLVQEEKVSPSLGENAFKGALIATGVGTLAIIIYVFFIYGWRKATVTVLTMIFYFTILLAIIKLIDYALSLSGIAAIILSIGMAIDANILIFERMNEEVKEGKTYKSAISTANARSRSAIRDGQISTLLIWILLFRFGINMFKGFGSMIILTALLTLFLNVPFIIETLYIIYNKKD